MKSEAYAVLSYPRSDYAISSGMLERRFGKLEGIKEIAINPISYTVKIRYDPRLISAEKIRSVLKLVQGK